MDALDFQALPPEGNVKLALNTVSGEISVKYSKTVVKAKEQGGTHKSLDFVTANFNSQAPPRSLTGFAPAPVTTPTDVSILSLAEPDSPRRNPAVPGNRFQSTGSYTELDLDTTKIYCTVDQISIPKLLHGA